MHRGHHHSVGLYDRRLAGRSRRRLQLKPEQDHRTTYAVADATCPCTTTYLASLLSLGKPCMHGLHPARCNAASSAATSSLIYIPPRSISTRSISVRDACTICCCSSDNKIHTGSLFAGVPRPCIHSWLCDDTKRHVPLGSLT
jgi:hypothetical protein